MPDNSASGKSFIQLLLLLCLVCAVVAPSGFLVLGPSGISWGLGWGLTAALAWRLLFNARWGLIQGLSAGLCVGVAFGPDTYALGILPGIMLPSLAWGFLGAWLLCMARISPQVTS